MIQRIQSFVLILLLILITPFNSGYSKDLSRNERLHQIFVVLPFISEEGDNIENWFSKTTSDLMRGYLTDLSHAVVLNKQETDKAIETSALGRSDQISIKILNEFKSLTSSNWIVLGKASQTEKRFDLRLRIISLDNPKQIKKIKFAGGLDSLALTLKEATAEIAEWCELTLPDSDKEGLFKPDDFNFETLDSLYQAKRQIQRSQIKTGELLLSEIIEEHPGFNEAILALSELYVSEQQRSKAIAVLKLGIEQNPASIQLLLQLGHVHSEGKNYLQAKEFYERVLLKSPYETSALMALSEIFYHQKLYELALDAAQKGIRYSANKSQFYAFIGKIYQAKGDFVFALEMYKRALKLDPKNGEIIKRQGIVMALLGDYEKAQTIYSEAINQSAQQQSIVRRSQKNEFKQTEYQNQEIQNYLDQLKKDPKNVLALNGLGTAWEQEGEWVKGEESFKKAISVNATFQPAFFNLAVNLAQQEKSKAAISTFRKGIELNPKHLASYMHLGDYYWKLKKLKKATQTWEEGLAQIPANQKLVDKIVHGYARMDKWKKVIKTYRNLAKLKGSDEQASLWIGRLYLQYGKDKKALKYFKEGLVKNPERSEPYKELAVYYDFYGNDPKKAIEYYETYLNFETELEVKEDIEVRLTKIKASLEQD